MDFRRVVKVVKYLHVSVEFVLIQQLSLCDLVPWEYFYLCCQPYKVSHDGNAGTTQLSAPILKHNLSSSALVCIFVIGKRFLV